MTLEDNLQWLYSLNAHGIKLGLDTTRELLSRLGDPHLSFRPIHVAGSDGKGSVCAMIHSILVEAGIEVGLYTSPHILRFNERIVVGRREVSDDEILSLLGTCRPIAEEMAKEGRQLTFFEVTTAMAFKYFADRGVEYAVLETGMGGRLDATNVVVPDVTVITPIGLEHRQHLGETIEAVSREKAGIIKKGVPVVYNCSAEAEKAISERAREIDAPLYPIGKEYRLLSMDRYGVTIEYKERKYRVSIPGSFQAANATTAMRAIEVLRDPRVDDATIRRGLRSCHWPCRMELVREDPVTVVDVTHTAMGATFLAQDFPYIYGKGNILVIGMLGDKDINGVASLLGPVFRKVIATEADTDRALAADTVAKAFMLYCNDVVVEEKVGDAMALAYAHLRPNEAVLVTGSLYTAGDALKWMGEKIRF